MTFSRRTFCAQTATLLFTPRILLSQAKPSSRPDVATIDRDRILQQANAALKQSPTPLPSIPAPHSPGTPKDFYSEADEYWPDPATPSGPYLLRAGMPNPDAFTAHRDALLNLSMQVSALTAAFVLTRAASYATPAVAHLKAWFIEPATSMTPSIMYGQVIPPAKTGRPEGVLDAVPLAEIVVCIPFLANSEALTATDRTALVAWFAQYFEWLNTTRLAGLARDQKNHHGSSWLLQASAIARLNEADDRPLTTLRHQYKSSTIRAQMRSDGTFPNELSTPNPYRNSLFNLDMLAAVCLLLSTRFESIWDFDLADGPGIRSVIARHYPFILDRGRWPYLADNAYFKELPLRRPCLLFAARVYDRPEYADLWKTLPPDTTNPVLQRTFPIRQPLLWVTRSRA